MALGYEGYLKILTAKDAEEIFLPIELPYLPVWDSDRTFNNLTREYDIKFLMRPFIKIEWRKFFYQQVYWLIKNPKNEKVIATTNPVIDFKVNAFDIKFEDSGAREVWQLKFLENKKMEIETVVVDWRATEIEKEVLAWAIRVVWNEREQIPLGYSIEEADPVLISRD